MNRVIKWFFYGIALFFAITKLCVFKLGLDIALIFLGGGQVVMAIEDYKDNQKEKALYMGIAGIFVIILTAISIFSRK